MGSMDRPTLEGTRRKISIPVTKEIIDKAMVRDSSHCMIADAVRIAIPEAKSVSVDLATIRFTDPIKKKRYIYLTPPSAQAALVNFDQGIPVEPFTLRLHRAAQVVESGYRTAPDGTKQRPSQKQRGVSSPGRKYDSGNVPTRIGGTPPPNGALATGRGRIRAFGLRNLKS